MLLLHSRDVAKVTKDVFGKSKFYLYNCNTHWNCKRRFWTSKEKEGEEFAEATDSCQPSVLSSSSSPSLTWLTWSFRCFQRLILSETETDPVSDPTLPNPLGIAGGEEPVHLPPSPPHPPPHPGHRPGDAISPRCLLNSALPGPSPL